MTETVQYICFAAMDYAAMVIYGMRACRYSESLLEMQRVGKKAFLPAAALLLMWMAAFSELPVLVIFLFLYSILMLYFLLSYRNSLSVALFASGTFLFHIVNLYMLLFGVFSLICNVRSMEYFRGNYLYPVLILLVLLASMICLEIFDRVIDQKAIMLLIENKRQLQFAATSLMFIDVYLLILSIVYTSSIYTSMMLLFLIITSVLLFGAFYTSFLHAVRMSLLEMYEIRFKDLESQLEQSNRSIGKLKDEAYRDSLTGVASRRHGLLKLERMVQDKRKLSVCLVDLDGLKAVNDSLGHQGGDLYLTGVARVLAETFGADSVCRLGGDEFLIMIPDRTEEEAEQWMETACRNMEKTFQEQDIPIRPSVSYGAVEVGKIPFAAVSDILELADRKMYARKKERHKMRE